MLALGFADESAQNPRIAANTTTKRLLSDLHQVDRGTATRMLNDPVISADQYQTARAKETPAIEQVAIQVEEKSSNTIYIRHLSLEENGRV